MPRDSYPMTRPGYLTWRAKQKTQAAAQVQELLSSSTPEDAGQHQGAASLLPAEECERIAALIGKQDLATNEETQVLEDVACLVFLDDQFDDFEKKPDHDEDKVVRILRKTWVKMSPRGQEMALQMKHSDRAMSLIGKALNDS